MVDNVTTVEIRLSRAEATLDPAVKGTLASLTGLSVNQIRSDLANKAYSPYQPAPILANAPANIVQFIKLHPSEFPASRCSTSRDVPIRWAATLDPRCSATSVQSPERDCGPPGRRLPDRLDDRPDRYRGLLRAVPARHDGTNTIEVGSNGSVIGTLHTTQPKIGDSVVLTSTPDSKVRSTES